MQIILKKEMIILIVYDDGTIIIGRLISGGVVREEFFCYFGLKYMRSVLIDPLVFCM